MTYKTFNNTQPTEVITPTTISQEYVEFFKHVFSYKRKHNSQTETQWLDEVLLPLIENNNLQKTTIWVDDVGNIHVDTRRTAQNRTLFTAHVDTVHNTEGRQLVEVVQRNGVNTLRLTPPPYGTPAEYTSNCLGADDTAGVLILLHLLQSNVPAYYIFTRGEECGGIGASYLSEHHKDLLAEFDRAIAFDRRGTSSVITHQMVGRTCSDKFAEALSDALGTDTLMFAPDDTGSYTDTAEFIMTIPECTNISTGYYREHSAEESLDLDHFMDLMHHVTTMDWDILPVERDPTAVDPMEQYNYGYNYGYGYTPKDLHTDYADIGMPHEYDYIGTLPSVTEQDVIDLIKALRCAQGGDSSLLYKVLDLKHATQLQRDINAQDAQYFIEELEYLLDTKHSQITPIYYEIIGEIQYEL